MKIWLDDLRPAPWGYESARSVNEAKTLIREAERNGIEIDLLPRGDTYREPRGQSEYGENASEVLGRGVLVENRWQPPRKKVCKILLDIVMHIIEGAILS